MYNDPLASESDKEIQSPACFQATLQRGQSRSGKGGLYYMILKLSVLESLASRVKTDIIENEV